MSKLGEVKKFEKHHAALLVFMLIAGVFLINIFAFSAAYSRVREARSAGAAPVIVIGYEEDEEEDPIQEIKFLDGLRPQIESVIESEGIETAVLVKNLETDEVMGINERTTFVSASLYKIFVAYEVARQIDVGQIEPDQNTGYDAQGISVQECLYRTLSYSDNPCGRALRKLISADSSPVSAINEAGFIGTSLANDYPTTSASDVSLFFETLYRAREFNPETNNMLLDPLLNQEINNRLPDPLPEDTKIAHKTADLDGYSHDAGIFYTPNGDYILVVLSGPWPNGYSDAPSLHIAVSSLVYDWFNGSNDPASF